MHPRTFISRFGAHDRKPRLTAIAWVVVAALLSCGCGGSGAGAVPTTVAPTVTTTDAPANDHNRQAADLQRSQEQLLRAYEPASQYLNYYVSAYELFERDLGRSAETRRVAREYRRILDATRRAVRRAQVEGAVSRVQRELLTGLDRRILAMDLVQVYLVRRATGDHDTRTINRYRDTFDGSIGNARIATNLLQLQREAVGLEPAREDAVR